MKLKAKRKTWSILIRFTLLRAMGPQKEKGCSGSFKDII